MSTKRTRPHKNTNKYKIKIKNQYIQRVCSGGRRAEVFLEQKGLEMSFKEWEGGTVTEGLRKGVPEFGGHGAERLATKGRESGAGDREEIVVR